MSIDEALEAVEQILLLRQLSPIERFVFQQSWLGRNYHDMAQECSYGTTYIKEIGSQLWQDLSKAVGERVSKKNLHLVLGQYKRHLAEHAHRKAFTSVDQTLSDPVNAGDSTYHPLGTDANGNVNNGISGVNNGVAKRTGFNHLSFHHKISNLTPLEFPSGCVPLDSPLYIERPPVEELVFAEIQQPGSALRIRAPKNMGKSSLLVRILANASVQGCKTVFIDFQEADGDVVKSLDRLLRWFCINVSRQLDLEPSLADHWDESMGSKVSCKIYFESYLLSQIHVPIVLALNEVNRIFEHPSIAHDFLSMLRLWYEQARQNSSWRKLRFVMLQSTEFYTPLNLKPFSFDVGLSLTLPPFLIEQMQSLALRYGLTWAEGEMGQQRLLPLQKLTGGYPYLVNLAFYHLYRETLSLERLLETAPQPNGIYGQFLRNQLTVIQNSLSLTSALHQVIHVSSGVRLDPAIAYELEGMGLIQLEGALSRISCELYRLYFRNHLSDSLAAIGASLPQGEVHS
ncbi:MAG: hypothetical protein HC827_04065 [Cyanobacteria bacterium RM1_2_2]|nr:hypothetical protein [Cyanobacteria bacterium RM1_2_2]